MRKDTAVNVQLHRTEITLVLTAVAALALTALVGTATRSISLRLRSITSETGSSCSCGPL